MKLPNEQFCSKCGATIPAGSRFCEKCGQPLARAPLTSRLKTDKRFLLSVIGAAVAVVVVILLVVTVVVPSFTGPHPPPAAAGPDYSGYFNSMLAPNPGWTLVQPYTKSTSHRGNAVYTGIYRNVTKGGQNALVIELMPSLAAAKHAYDQTVAQKTNQGFTPRPDMAANDTAQHPDRIEDWVGLQGNNVTGAYVYTYYSNNSAVSPPWEFVTQTVS